MGVPTRNPEPMTAEEFFAFTATRPDEEKWELIEGEPVLNASASHLHQRIVGNVLRVLMRIEETQKPSDSNRWEVLPGLGVRVSPINIPIPDILIRPFDNLMGVECDDIIVAFEILSPSTADRDLRWKRQAYAKLASLAHYVVIAQDAVEVFVYDRANGFAERRLDRLNGALELSAVELALPLADIYRNTGLQSA
ncbi:MAG TPA: Uma2 family endonuclease [Methylovirgula sp.]